MSPQTQYKLIFSIISTLGILLRIFLLNKTHLRQWLENRVEISTPLTSWSRVLEGVSLSKLSTSSYEGDLVHEIPIMLKFYQVLLTVFNANYIKYAFVIVDSLNAFVLCLIAKKVIRYLNDVEALNKSSGRYQHLLETKLGENHNRLNTFLITPENFSANFWSLFTLAVYLFNPFGWSSCVALSSVIVHNFILLMWLYFLLDGNILFALTFLALHANITVYSVVLVFASISFLIHKSKCFSKEDGKINSFQIVGYASLFFLLTCLVFFMNLVLENFNPRFIECTYIFIMKTPELMPNLGLFWYFLTEMFDHFLIFFTIVFQMNAFIYAIPLTIRLKDDPIVNIFVQVGLLAVLKSYPSVGDTSLYISMLPMLSYLFPLMRNILVYSCMLLASTVLAPVMFYLWLGSGGGNANFYFAITLVNAVGQIFLIVDVLYASLKREFIKKNGADIPISKSGKVPALFALE